jgi:FdhE protein
MPPQRNNQAHWEKRIERARVLAETYPFAAQVLAFYREIAAFQKSLLSSLKPVSGNGKERDADLPFGDCLDLVPILPSFPVFLKLIERVGTPVLAQAATKLAREEPGRWEGLLLACWKTGGKVVEGTEETHLFFARAFLQPCAEELARRRAIELPRFGSSTCPICGGRPQVGVLREEGHGAKRSLVCSLCLTEWDYRRVICPACGEDEFEKLSAYTASQFEHMRVEACETCKTYINTVDLTKNGLAIPEVDELAAIPLSLWAQEKGYTKLQRNLLGL